MYVINQRHYTQQGTYWCFGSTAEIGCKSETIIRFIKIMHAFVWTKAFFCFILLNKTIGIRFFDNMPSVPCCCCTVFCCDIYYWNRFCHDLMCGSVKRLVTTSLVLGDHFAQRIFSHITSAIKLLNAFMVTQRKTKRYRVTYNVMGRDICV